MRTDVLSFALGSENRKKAVRTLFEYPKRQWSCTFLEQAAKLPHATVFRTLQGLVHFKLVKTTKINKRDLLYELASGSPFMQELKNVLTIEQRTSRQIAIIFVNKIKSRKLLVALLYGSVARGESGPESDIDIFLLLTNHNKNYEKKIYNAATETSVEANKAISPLLLDRKEWKKEKNSNFIKSIEQNHEVLYGKTPF